MAFLYNELDFLIYKKSFPLGDLSLASLTIGNKDLLRLD